MGGCVSLFFFNLDFFKGVPVLGGYLAIIRDEAWVGQKKVILA